MTDSESMDNEFEVVLGLVCAAGTDLSPVIEAMTQRLCDYGCQVREIRISKDVIPNVVDVPKIDDSNECERISKLMDAGNEARKKSKSNSVLAIGASAKIKLERQSLDTSRRAYIINSLKHPQEVQALRGIYGPNFHLIGVFSDEEEREQFIGKSLSEDRQNSIQPLMKRDEDEKKSHGQRTRDTFHHADFFLHTDPNTEKVSNTLGRFLDIIFGDHTRTPTFDEFAMFMAFSSALRSGDLSRQIGAVIARDDEILATGANDCPQFGGGLYMSKRNETTGEVVNVPLGRDSERNVDSNAQKKAEITQNVLDQIKPFLKDGTSDEARKAIADSEIKDITEYGRVVHAEMEALLACSRIGVTARNGTLYTTTFPCHNCAKHIVAAGISRVVYVEPYPKSKALEFHDESIYHGFREQNKELRKVCFESFMGVGPRHFFDFFSMRLGSGYSLKRKMSDGTARAWDHSKALPRLGLTEISALDREASAAVEFQQHCDGG